jgi:hypothetical protein
MLMVAETKFELRENEDRRVGKAIEDDGHQMTIGLRTFSVLSHTDTATSCGLLAQQSQQSDKPVVGDHLLVLRQNVADCDDSDASETLVNIPNGLEESEQLLVEKQKCHFITLKWCQNTGRD